MTDNLFGKYLCVLNKSYSLIKITKDRENYLGFAEKGVNLKLVVNTEGRVEIYCSKAGDIGEISKKESAEIIPFMNNEKYNIQAVITNIRYYFNQPEIVIHVVIYQLDSLVEDLVYNESYTEKTSIKLPNWFDNYQLIKAEEIDVEKVFYGVHTIPFNLGLVQSKKVLKPLTEKRKQIRIWCNTHHGQIITLIKKITPKNYTILIGYYSYEDLDDNYLTSQEQYSFVKLDGYGYYYPDKDNKVLLMIDEKNVFIADTCGNVLAKLKDRATKKLMPYIRNTDYAVIPELVISEQDYSYDLIIKVYDYKKGTIIVKKQKEEKLCNALVDKAILEHNVTGIFEIEQVKDEYTSLYKDGKEVLQVNYDKKAKWVNILFPKVLKKKYRESDLAKKNANKSIWTIEFNEGKIDDLYKIVLDYFEQLSVS